MSERPAASVLRREWRAPATDRTALVVPTWPELPQLVATNARWFVDRPLSGDLDWSRWRQEARQEVLAAAGRYTSEIAGGAVQSAIDGPLIVDGHQPELFHPGVWAKNFAIDRLARRCSAQSLHLIVDNDVLSRTAIRLPSGTADSPHIVLEPFDHAPTARPWEEARVTDRACFASFAERVACGMQNWCVTPLIETAWPAALNRLQHTDSLVACLTAARVAVERRWGLANLELPVSQLSATPSFQRFAALAFSRHREVVRHYNDVVREYRRTNRVRNKAHPVPDLAVQDAWYEMPFRLWRSGDVRRQRAFVRSFAGRWELRDESNIVATWSNASDAALTAIAGLAMQGIRLRPRALTLTLFARMVLADLFVHGLGGAKYDEMTDALAARLFGAPPPPYLTLTATVRLPLGCGLKPNAQAADIGAARQRLWEFQHNPQRFVDGDDPAARTLAEEKRSLLAEAQPFEHSARRRRYLRLREINAELGARLSSVREQLRQALGDGEHKQQANRILLSREFSGALFPEGALRSFYEDAFPL